MLKIKISNLHDGEHDYEFIVKGKDLELDEIETVEDIHIKVKLYKSVNQFDLRVNLNGKIKFECDRCLDDYNHDFTNSFEIIYKFDFSHELESSDSGNDEIRYINPNSAYIDLKNDIRDFIMLSVPLKHAPEEKDGVCTLCRRNISELYKTEKREEMNPVWEQLLKIKTK